MRSIDRLEQQKRLRQQKENRPQPDWETEEEQELPRFLPLNRTKTVFDADAEHTFGGLNTTKSVFDQKAVFRMGE